MKKQILTKIQQAIEDKRIQNIKPQVIILNKKEQAKLSIEMKKNIGCSYASETAITKILGLYIIGHKREIIELEELKHN